MTTKLLCFLLLCTPCFAQPGGWYSKLASQNTAPVIPFTFTPTNTFVWYNAGAVTATNGELGMTWADGSSNGYNAWVFGATNTYSPYFSNSVSVLNGRPSWVWPGTSGRAFTNAFGSTLAQPWTVIMVWRGWTTTAGELLFDSVSSSPRMNLQTYGTSPYPLSLYAGSLGLGPDAMPWGTTTVITAYFDGANSYARSNGVAWFTTTNIGTAGSKGLTIGGRYDLTGILYGKEFIPELIMYRGTMADADRDWTETNLMRKYQ